jgi:DUF1365 family protein|tara:strand:- start:35 stop:802 length:768 start_codon:yes stop_codon:yes gene_type:complete
MSLSTGHFLYSGEVKHRRYTPFKREFSYPVFMLYLDINDLNNVMDKSIFWNVNKAAMVSFNRLDYHNAKTESLDQAVRDTVQKKVGNRPSGKIRMLAHLRYFGYCFNPVTFYYCFNREDDQVEFILAEVTNTPWKERFSYVLKASGNNKEKKIKSTMKKELHVSPFWDMDHMYDWSFSRPEDKLGVYMKNFKDGQKVFDATLNMKRLILNRNSLLASIFKFPFITIKVVFWIHLQAFFLWLRGATFFVHPNKTKN